MTKKKIFVNKNPDGRFYCPTCGHELHWGSSASRSDVDTDIPEEDGSSINYYDFAYCGSSVEQYEASDEEKPQYPFWNDELKDEYEDV